LIRITDIDKHGNISEKDLKYANTTKKFKTDNFLSKGDIMVSRQAFPARVGIFEGEKAVLSSNLVKVKFNEELLLPKYFLWFSQTPEWENQVKELTIGTAQPVFSANSLKEIQIPVPNLEEQKIIIDKHERKNKTIANLKEAISEFQKEEKELLNSFWKVSIL
jgi:type I restriction enzyme S subunit